MLGRKERKNSAIKTLVGSNTEVNGDVEFSGGLHVDGYIRGNVIAEDETHSLLSISENGCVEGSVSVPYVILNGTVRGDLRAREKVELGVTARVIGDVHYKLIEMAVGAEINGKLVHESLAKPALLTQTVDASPTDKIPIAAAAKIAAE